MISGEHVTPHPKKFRALHRKPTGRASQGEQVAEEPISIDRQTRQDTIAWVGQCIIPHEAELRRRLGRIGVPTTEIGDIVQDAYVAITRLESVTHIRNPRAYFFTTARNALLQRVRHDRIVRIDTLTEANMLVIPDDEPDPHRHTSARMELARVQRLIDALPSRCREIFLLRRVHGVPQREIALRLGVSEAVVEAQAIRGLRLILTAIENEDMAAVNEQPARSEQDHERHER